MAMDEWRAYFTESDWHSNYLAIVVMRTRSDISLPPPVASRAVLVSMLSAELECPRGHIGVNGLLTLIKHAKFALTHFCRSYASGRANHLAWRPQGALQRLDQDGKGTADKKRPQP
ncbi:MAG: hypothetical protein AB7P20_19710 [Rhizobiaceae bacterium]